MLVMCFKAELFRSFFSFFSHCLNSYLKLAYVSKRGLCIVTFPPCSLSCQQLCMLWSLKWASGPWATSSTLLSSVGCIGPAVKCDQSAPLGPELGAVWEHTVQSHALPPRSWSAGIGWSHRHLIPHCVNAVMYHRLVYPLLAQASILKWNFAVI